MARTAARTPGTAALIVAAALLLVTGACGNDEPDDDTDAAASASGTSSTVRDDEAAVESTPADGDDPTGDEADAPGAGSASGSGTTAGSGAPSRAPVVDVAPGEPHVGDTMEVSGRGFVDLAGQYDVPIYLYRHDPATDEDLYGVIATTDIDENGEFLLEAPVPDELGVRQQSRTVPVGTGDYQIVVGPTVNIIAGTVVRITA